MDNQNKTQKKYRFTVFDFLVILFIVALIAAVVLRAPIQRLIENATSHDVYYVNFVAESVSYDSVTALESTHDETNGENWVYLSDGVTKLGSMIKGEGTAGDNLNFTPADANIKTESGKTVIAQYPGEEKDVNRIKYDVSDIIIACEGFESSRSGHFMLNGKTDIAPGSELSVRTKYGDFTLKVTAITPAQ